MATGVTDLERRLEELTILNETIRTLASTLELPEVLRIVLERIKTVTSAEALSLLLYDPERDELVFAATETLRENAIVGLPAPLEQSLAGRVARTGRSEIVDDPANDPRAAADPCGATRPAARNLLAVPVRRRGRVVGVLELANRRGRGFDDADRTRLEGVGDRLLDGIDPEALARDPQALRAALTLATSTVPSEGAFLLLHDPQGHDLVFHASRVLEAGAIDGLRIPCDRGIAGWVARHREAVRLDDAASDPRHYSGLQLRTGVVPRSMICVPMVSRETLRGVIQVLNRLDGGCFTEHELRLTQALADHAAIAIENASLYREAYVASITDDLTGLANARRLNALLPELLRRSTPLSLLVVDLDHFKQVVDAFGHQAGSRAIGHVGRLIGRMIRVSDVAARFGGDEFVVVLPGADTAVALQRAEAIRAAIEGERGGEIGIDLAGVTASIGVATAPAHGATADEIFRAADAAMYAAKRRGKNAVSTPPRVTAGPALAG